jgi:hypothetical protein
VAVGGPEDQLNQLLFVATGSVPQGVLDRMYGEEAHAAEE